MNSRLLSFDLLKVFAIFFVLWGHCIQYFLSTHYSDDSIYRVIYSFHMPLFMMVSGYFSIQSYHLTYKSFFNKKFHALITPVLIWDFIYIIICIIVKLLKQETLYNLHDIVTIFYEKLWFLKSLFVCYLLAFMCFQKDRPNYTALFTTLFISQFIVSHNICIMYPAFLTGIFLNRYNNILLSTKTICISLTFFIIMIIYWDASFWPIPNMLDAIRIHSFTPIRNYLYKGVFRILIGISGSMFFISLFTKTFRGMNSRQICYLADMGKYTLEVYILQSFILETIAWKYINLDNIDFKISHFVYTPLISGMLLLILVKFAKISHQSKVLSYYLWGKKLTTKRQL